MTIDVNNESGVAVDEKALADLGRFVLDRLRIHPLAELSVLLVDSDAMAALHVQWMDEAGPTDVLSFPMDELRPGTDDREPEPGLLGDVVLCPQVAIDQAASAGHSAEHELHLLGYDHGEPAEEKQMFDLQRDLLRAWQERGGSDSNGSSNDAEHAR